MDSAVTGDVGSVLRGRSGRVERVSAPATGAEPPSHWDDCRDRSKGCLPGCPAAAATQEGEPQPKETQSNAARPHTQQQQKQHRGIGHAPVDTHTHTHTPSVHTMWRSPTRDAASVGDAE